MELPEILAERRLGIASAIDARNLDNQCVFLSHYKIKYRTFKSVKIVAAAHPKTLRYGDQEQDGSPRTNTDSESESESSLEIVPARTNVSQCHVSANPRK